MIHHLVMVLICVCALVIHGSEGDCEMNNQTYTPGQSWKVDGQCVQMTCLDSGGITGSSCPLVQVSNDYYLTEEDPSKDYPDCCPQPKLKQES